MCLCEVCVCVCVTHDLMMMMEASNHRQLAMLKTGKRKGGHLALYFLKKQKEIHRYRLNHDKTEVIISIMEVKEG